MVPSLWLSSLPGEYKFLSIGLHSLLHGSWFSYCWAVFLFCRHLVTSGLSFAVPRSPSCYFLLFGAFGVWSQCPSDCECWAVVFPFRWNCAGYSSLPPFYCGYTLGCQLVGLMHFSGDLYCIGLYAPFRSLSPLHGAYGLPSFGCPAYVSPRGFYGTLVPLVPFC